ncbi:MAG: protein kinase [Planctomycetes bacterium]|nr:protein kinase [Planctomycetota bacterium]MCG2685279.1 protein kinase [Planctomycetales bacterium]
MADTFTKSERLPCLSEFLAERGDWPLKDRLAFVQKLARQVQALHQNGRIHRAIHVDTVAVDEQLRPQLSPPGAPRRFGGEDDCDPEFCPPELTEPAAVELPAEIDRAAKALQEAGYALDPRRVDVYQLGVLLCRLATGEPVLSYIYDAKIKSRVPAVARLLLEGALGFDTPERFENCERLIEGLDEALRRAESLEAPTSMIETPARGSVPDGDTPPQGTQQPPARIVEPLPFTRLGHYRIVEWIGGGGMGDVYRGYDESLERPVAVKVLPFQLARDADFVRRFHAEATAAAGVAHPNVVPIYFIGEDAGHHFFAMQCVEGESLAERLDRQGQLPVDEALELIGQCLAGLQAAHGCGLIHRDIKPGNILLERGSGRAMLVDFGLVRRLDQSAQMTATGVIMGTVDYIAPEQARGRKIDARADIYSLGVLFYQLLSGRMPFAADSPTAMIFQHAYEQPFPLEEAVPGLPPPVAQIVERMMAKEPDHRYPDCGAVLADVRAYRQGQPLASNESAWAMSGFEEESTPGGEPKLPEGLARLLEPGRLQGVRDWAATMFRRHAPEYIRQMQGTTQQVDAAVAHYRRRRNRLAKLLEEARAIEADLSQQIESNQSAASAAAAAAESAAGEERRQAALAKQGECEEQLAALRPQHELQQEQAADLERQLGKADATLARLCSQQEVMKARLQAAVARQRLEGGLPRPKVRRWLLPAAIGGAGLLAVASLLLILPRPNVPTDLPQPASPAATMSVATNPAPAAEQPPKPNPKVPPGAALLMTFDKNTLLEVSGMIFRVRSLTGRNNGQDVSAQWTPNGKVGGAISIEDGTEVRIPGHIVNRQPEYTVAAWFNRRDKEHLWIYSEAANGAIFAVEAEINGAIAVRSWHRERIGNWMEAKTPAGLVPANQWVFVAVRLIKGDQLDKGELTIRVNDSSYARNLQMAYSDNSGFSSVGTGNGRWEDRTYGRGFGLVDELAVYQRALSDAEIETLYQMGLRGESLGK